MSTSDVLNIELVVHKAALLFLFVANFRLDELSEGIGYVTVSSLRHGEPRQFPFINILIIGIRFVVRRLVLVLGEFLELISVVAVVHRGSIV